MPANEPLTATVWEDASATLMARIVGIDAAAITQATISSIAYRIADRHTKATIDSDTLTVSSVVFDTLQTDARWTADATGYNFRWTLSAAQLPTGNRSVSVDLTLTTTGGDTIPVVFHLTTRARDN